MEITRKHSYLLALTIVYLEMTRKQFYNFSVFIHYIISYKLPSGVKE